MALLPLVSIDAAAVVPLPLCAPPQPAAITASITATPAAACGQSVLLTGVLLVCWWRRHRLSGERGVARELRVRAWVVARRAPLDGRRWCRPSTLRPRGRRRSGRSRAAPVRRR